MTAAIRSRLECIASESTPRLPVATARKILSDTSTTAEPTDASAVICFTELGLDSGMAASLGGEITVSPPQVYDVRQRDARGAAASVPRLSELPRGLLQRGRRHQWQAARLAVRAVYLDFFEQQRRSDNVGRHAVLSRTEGPERRAGDFRVLALLERKNGGIVADPHQI